MGISEINNASMAPAFRAPADSASTGRQTTTARLANDAGTVKDSSNAQNRSGSAQDVQAAVDRFENFVKTATSDLAFSVDHTSGATVVKVIDRSTGDVIRQIPSQEMLELSHALDRLQGLLLKKNA